jgi:hypothetical protein
VITVKIDKDGVILAQVVIPELGGMEVSRYIHKM